jgi:hypothetical protein
MWSTNSFDMVFTFVLGVMVLKMAPEEGLESEKSMCSMKP